MVPDASKDVYHTWHEFPIDDYSACLAWFETHDATMTGAALELLQEHASDAALVAAIVERTKIFARTRPHLKTWIVTSLMASGHCVGMCGDGTNDCGALKAAHIGLALSDAEASLGIFNLILTRYFDHCYVVTLLCEGRCALMTSLLSFKYMLLYPIIETSLISVINSYQASLSNNQYLCDDLFIVLGLSLLMLQTGPARRLARERPPDSLFARIVKYVPDESGDMKVHAYEVSIAFASGYWFYITLAMVFNWNGPFRASISSNWPFVLYVVTCAGVALSLVLLPDKNAIAELLGTPLPTSFSYQMFGLMMVYTVVASVYERILHR
ncbi:hypothetical protein SDRG_13557 [Saprolegnia diclina VS20]|uniref:Cation-transporting P-type ATPase C-terminal domain-containing protein n=1 Tax=Saprolegnia diclina (strain VS20) TaxID=1156394 RepID=T0RG64_SAPDV|nr:hypothetical protein SDRG_13557 [Saprolegnia diclina VS20]EQC28682.1 hypothetical protein SDRG_13557 [Saprolegnia diclina VS20]|eukprot:XP_008617874.1 hypothetical protein SDRG_13557 [Saprolegnia diclina VS20]